MPTRRPRSRANRLKDGGPDNARLAVYGSNIMFKQPAIRNIRRNITPGTLPKSALDTGYAVRFEVGNVIDWTELSQLYDQYRLDKVIYTIELTTPFLSGVPYPRLVIAPDYNDDTSAPAAETDVLALESSRMYQFSPTNTKVSVHLVPKPAMAGYQSVTSSGYAILKENPFFSCSSSQLVDFYGLKFYVADYNSTISAVPQVRTYATYFLSMRGTR